MNLLEVSSQDLAAGRTDVEAARWYALKVFYNRVFDIDGMLRCDASVVESYIPCRKCRRQAKGGASELVDRPVVSSLMFIKTTDRSVRRLRYDFSDRFSVYSRPGAKLWEPAVVPERELEIFRRVVSVGDEGLELIEIDERKFSKGQKVRVTGGVFAGAEGRIVRIKGDHRLVVEIQGICAVATSYIPKCHLQEILD